MSGATRPEASSVAPSVLSQGENKENTSDALNGLPPYEPACIVCFRDEEDDGITIQRCSICKDQYYCVRRERF